MKPENQLRGSFIIEGEQSNIEVYFTLSPENPPLIQEYRIRELTKEKDINRLSIACTEYVQDVFQISHTFTKQVSRSFHHPTGII